MNFFLDLMATAALWGGFVAIAGSALVWLIFTLPSHPRERAWYLERGEGRWFSRAGHTRGFSLLRASRPADYRAIAEFERLAEKAERARSWANLATIPFMLVGLIALASALVLINVSSFEGVAHRSWVLPFLLIYLWTALGAVTPAALSQILPRKILPPELGGAMHLADVLSNLSAPSRPSVRLGSSSSRTLRPLERMARRSFLAAFGQRGTVPLTKNSASLSKATTRLCAMAAGVIEVTRRDEVDTAWGLAAVWRPDVSRGLSRQVIDIHWLPRKYWPKLSIASASAVGLSALAGFIEIFKAISAS